MVKINKIRKVLRMKILTVLGARPQFIKAGNISREISKQRNCTEIIVHTGQHYDVNMSDIFFKEMRLPKPNYFLGIGGKSHGAMTGQMIEKIENVVFKEKPDWIIVYGDTNSTLAGAVVASKLNINLAHVESGLRSFNNKMPEELNRILTDRISQLLFCPTITSVQNLKKEGFENFDCKIVQTGDVMKDGVIFYKQFASAPKFDIKDNFVLCTVHRAENTDDTKRLNSILQALESIAIEKQVILPLHPRTKSVIKKLNYSIRENISVIDPVGYFEMIWLIDNCDLVLTDSGGLQKEAFFFQKPCLTLRNETEWLELTENKVNVLVGSDKNTILDAYYNFKFNMNLNDDLYGDGSASKKIIEEICNWKI